MCWRMDVMSKVPREWAWSNRKDLFLSQVLSISIGHFLLIFRRLHRTVNIIANIHPRQNLLSISFNITGENPRFYFESSYFWGLFCTKLYHFTSSGELNFNVNWSFIVPLDLSCPDYIMATETISFLNQVNESHVLHFTKYTFAKS